jgi:tetratricopeptide (TPR) repeat protein
MKSAATQEANDMVRRVLARSALLAILLTPTPAAAQSLRIHGANPDAQRCFESAQQAVQFEQASPFERIPCGTALEASGLSAGDRSATYVNRGVISMALREYESALADFDAAMALHPSHGAIYLNRGNVFFRHGSYDSAISEYTRALASEMAEYQVAYLNRGMAHESLGNLAIAEDDYRQAVELAPTWGLALSKLARVMSKQN